MRKITDTKYKITKKDHGRIIKVGKFNFIKVAVEGEWDFWNHGFTDCRYIEKKDKFIYKDKKGNWYEKVD